MGQKSAYLDLTIISAADLKRKWLSGDHTVAVAWVDPLTKKTTGIGSRNGRNVLWHEKLILTLNGADTLLQGKLLTIEIHARGIWGNSLLGSVYVPLIELVSEGENRGNTTLMYQIVQPSGKRQGSMKFSAKVVKRTVSGSNAPLIGSVVPLPCAPPIVLPDDGGNGLGSNALYPPASSVCLSVETNDERPSSVENSTYPTVKVSPHPLQPLFCQNHAAGHGAGQHDTLPDPSYGMGSYPPHVYSPVNTAYPPQTSPAPCHSQSHFAGIISCPLQSPPVSETPYPPPTCAYPAPYPPIALHPSEMYSQASWYSNFSSPLYPPLYPQQQATAQYPYLSHCGRSF